jgi:predicted ABC-type transport system involved in lysophospholipase L1 biosynthesis ATPase subunit
MRGIAGLVGGLTVAAGLSACAAAPQSIAQSDVSPISYDRLNCFDLVDELEQVDASLIPSSQQQEQAQGSDTADGVSAIGVPASTLSSTDVAPQLGAGEEQRQAIRRALAQKQCRVTLDVERATSSRNKD